MVLPCDHFEEQKRDKQMGGLEVEKVFALPTKSTSSGSRDPPPANGDDHEISPTISLSPRQKARTDNFPGEYKRRVAARYYEGYDE